MISIYIQTTHRYNNAASPTYQYQFVFRMSKCDVKGELHLNVETINIHMERNESGVHCYRFAFEPTEAINVMNGKNNNILYILSIAT